MSRPAIVLDCDPGIDDAFAILTAARNTELIAITTVNGNVSVDKTTRNALVVAQLAALDVPVHRGAAVPLVAPVHDAARVHGESGLVGANLPPLERSPEGTDAVGCLLGLTRQRDDIHLVAIGPLTNVAIAIRTDPDFARRLASLTIMGGGVGMGNVTASAEFNIWSDPEAAAIVFDAGIPIRTIPLNVTHQVLAGHQQADELRAAGTTTAHFAADLLDQYGAGTSQTGVEGKGAIHDPCAVLSLTHPDLFELVERRLDVELTGTHTRGMTVVDERRFPSERRSNALVGYQVDADAVLRLILDASIDPR
ncbi:MAG TPA: nucleoside hydrolase [Acidimicrobiales bacterium]|jgi:inosine-uridine nucleoside N-ribohydrolase|nr:nucleoside hydrolase [Acidimicrobiales bacterium]